MENVLSLNPLDLKTESDVEQKFIIPLLASPAPLGLNYSLVDLRTKPDIRELTIGKGTSQKLYFPDYVILNSGLPLVIIEAKRPGEDLKEAYREARLYAAEINSKFPSKLNPCHKIVATDGIKTLCGYWDSDSEIEVTLDDINLVNSQYHKLQEFIKKENVFDFGQKIFSKIRGTTRFSRPLSLLGGAAAQNEELPSNGFGATLSLEFRYLFNPESYEERKNIVLNAYVQTKRLLRHVDPIDKIIKASIPFGVRNTSTIEDTANPKELIAKFIDKKVLRNQILLLVGSVGSGKSTFTDYLREVALDESLTKDTIWISLNLNHAPLNKEEIYSWLKNQIVNKLKEKFSDIDFDSLANQEKLFSVELVAFKKGGASILPVDSIEYKSKLADKLIALDSDLDLKSKAFVRYLVGERGKLLTVILDNCDKRGLEEQLLMFDVANWVKERFNCLVFLPIRDTTFDNFRKEPPLDTVIKDLVFRIDPPLLKEVIVTRLKYALREMSKGKNNLSFALPNGMKVEFPQSDQGYYLACIVKSLFEGPYFSRLITGLAGRDIRKGLEIFLDFCKSSHISETEILKIRYSKGDHSLPLHLISRIILRGNRKYYSDNSSLVKNLFASYPASETQPDPFCRLAVLRWLYNNLKKEGPSKSLGYHKISNLLNDLISVGHSDSRLKKEVAFLIKFKLAITESQLDTSFNDDDLIAIAPSGIIHLELLNDINYIAACAEDSWFRELNTAEEVQKRIIDRIGYGHFSRETAIENANALVESIEKYKSTYLIRKSNEFLHTAKTNDYTDLGSIKENIKKSYDENPLLRLKKLYPPGTIVNDCEVVSIQTYGIFVEFGIEGRGMIHVRSLENFGYSPSDFDLGELLDGEILEFNETHKRFNLKMHE